MNKIIAGFFFLFHLYCFADWNSDVLDWADGFGSPPEGLKSSEAITSWAAVQSYRFKYFNFLGSKKQKIRKISSKYFGKPGMEVVVRIQRDSAGKPAARPLVVFLPGIFGGIDSPSVSRAMQNYGSRGFHVLAISNPWDPKYLNQIPISNPGEATANIASPGNLEAEAAAVLDLVSQAKSSLFPAGGVTRTLLVGESYGALLGLIVGAKDVSPTPVIDGPISLFGPPLDIGGGLRSLDLGYLKSKPIYEARCKAHQARVAADMLLGSETSRWDTLATLCASSMVYQEFQHGLVGTARILQNTKGISASVAPDLQFEDFVSIFTPENAAELKSGLRTNFLFWVRQYPVKRRKLLRIMTAADDFLNREELLPRIEQVKVSWDLVKKEIEKDSGVEGQKSLIVLPWGGHVGFVGLKSFQKLVNMAFRREMIDIK